MTRQVIKDEGAFHKETRDDINDNFTENYADIATLQAAVISGFNVTNAGNLAATGSNQGTAAAITANVSNVTAADGTKAVVLPTASLGAIYIVYNSVASNGLPVFPASSGTINGGSANAAVTIEGKTLAIFVGTDSTNWASIFTADT